MTQPYILVQALSYQLPNHAKLLCDINLQLTQKRVGIVGDNGSGKTTLLKLLAGQLKPTSGHVQPHGKVCLTEQNTAAFTKAASIADALGVAPYLSAMQRIQNGSTNEKDYALMQDQWDIESRIEQTLSPFELWPVDYHKPFNELSGGQQTKIRIAKTQLWQCEFILLDEPTNNLDANSRDILYAYIASAKKGFIMASHDRTLLNLCEEIIEISPSGLSHYGGNFDFYRQQKNQKQQAQEREIKSRHEQLIKAKQLTQSRIERHQQAQSKGIRERKAQIKAKGSYDKITINAKKGRSENTHRRIHDQAERKLTRIEEQLSQAKIDKPIAKHIHACLEASRIANSKRVLSIKQLTFAYPNQTAVFSNFNLELVGPERIALTGKNGSGKSTLIQLILKKRLPQSGEIHCHCKKVAVLDQDVSFLDNELTLVENYLKQHPTATLFDAHHALAAFLFRNQVAHKKVGVLSGGERIRAGLAISLMSLQPPELVILDEPTNHLDLKSVAMIEQLIANYKGAVIAISHDAPFLDNIKIARVVSLDKP